MQATYPQVQYIRDLSKQLYGDEYAVQDDLGISRSANLVKKLTKQQASEIIDGLKAKLEAK